MANGLYDAYKQELLGDAAGPGHGTVDWEVDTLRAILMDNADYTVDLAAHQDFSDLTTAGRVGSGGGTTRTDGATIANPTVVMSSNIATMDGDDATLTAVTGDTAESVVIYKDSGADATSLLIVYFDTFSSGMPVTPNGGDITIQWNASGIWTM